MSDFHLLRPHWLWLLVVLLPILWAWWRHRQQRYGHYSWLASHLAKPLLKLPKQQQRGTGWLQLAFAVLISSFALAGPTWERLPQPVYQLNAGQVIILDMSLSTRATDVSPDRLTQLRYKARDLLSSRLDGETGLVAYAGDAFVISPLTSDKNNLLNLIPALSPEIMPEQGNYPQVAFARADEMLRNAGYPTGDIFWLTDGVESRDFTELTNQLRQLGHRVSTLAVGTREGAPIRQTDGTLLRDASGQVVVPRLYPDRLRQLTELTGGVFTRLTVDNQDIEQLLSLPPLSRVEQDSDGAPLQQGDQWLDRGPWLALLLLPLALLHWRRNGMLGAALLPVGGLSLLLSASMFSGQAQAQAQEESFSWWLTAEQQAQQALEQQQYERAAALSNDPLRRGTANYRAGNYEEALTDFAQVGDATGYYNQGNSLMQLENYQGAINAYQEALRQQPDLPQAQANLELAKRQLEKQKQEQEQQQSQDGEQNQNSQNSQGKQGEQDADGEQQQSESDQQEQDSGSESNQEQEPEAQDSQEQQDETGQTEEQQEEQQQADAGDGEEQAQQQAIEQATDGDLDAEQQREFEQMLKRLPDDPALLLRQKMRLEYQKRQQQQRRPEGVQQQW